MFLQEKTGFLKAMGGYASGRLTLHACDLEAEGAFDEVFVGCNGVVHTGAQLGRKNPQEYRAEQYVGTKFIEFTHPHAQVHFQGACCVHMGSCHASHY